jgi:uncharacterized membrane protein YciS (DUF1049 family)
MQFLKTLFWVMIAVIAVIFSYRNWTPITINLWGGLDADIKLPILVAIAFLIGFLPSFVLHKATRWQLRRKLDAAQRALEEARATNVQISDANIGGTPARIPIPPEIS